MGNIDKKLYQRYPTCCNDPRELPKTYDDLKILLQYTEKCRTGNGEKYLRPYSQFNFKNITRWVIEWKMAQKYVQRYPNLNWDIPLLLANYNTLPPFIVQKYPLHNWNYRHITEIYWYTILDYNIPWDFGHFQQCVEGTEDFVYRYDYSGKSHRKNITWLFRVMIKYRHRGINWHFPGMHGINRAISRAICSPNSILYGYNWPKNLLDRATMFVKYDEKFNGILEYWVYNPGLYKPTKD